MSTTYKFWMLHADGGSVPNVRHGDKPLAEAEAERLAQKTGRRVYVLEAVDFVEVQTPPVAWTRGIPEDPFPGGGE